MAEKIPKVLVLKPFRPDMEQVDSPVLTYPNLPSAVEKHVPYTQERWTRFLDENDPIGEEQEARALASQYLLQTALKATTVYPQESRRLWADRFTTSSSELYGEPDIEIAKQLFKSQVNELFSDSIEDSNLPGFLADTIDSQKGSAEFESISFESMYGEASREVHDYFYDTYPDIMEIFDALPDQPISPPEIAQLFEEVRSLLAKRDPEWDEWSVELIDNDKLSAGSGKINVGLHRRPASPTELKGLCGHEILVHALRAVNGKKLSPELASGLPGYLDAEEGLGVFVEYALTGNVPDKIIDRYIDIAAALGGIFDHPLTRQEMFDFVLLRNKKRAEVSGVEVEDKELKDKTWEHVNRIYRGSRGDEFVGVFTKDIVYFEGFRIIGDYLKANLADDKSIDEIMQKLLQGKFDPTNTHHVEFTDQLLQGEVSS